MKFILKKIWNYSFIVTVPMTVFVFLWLFNTVEMYNNFFLKQFRYPTVYSLHQVGLNLFDQMIYYVSDSLAAPAFKSEQKNHKLRTLELYIPQANLAKLNINLPYSGRQYVDSPTDKELPDFLYPEYQKGRQRDYGPYPQRQRRRGEKVTDRGDRQVEYRENECQFHSHTGGNP